MAASPPKQNSAENSFGWGDFPLVLSGFHDQTSQEEQPFKLKENYVSMKRLADSEYESNKRFQEKAPYYTRTTSVLNEFLPNNHHR